MYEKAEYDEDSSLHLFFFSFWYINKHGCAHLLGVYVNFGAMAAFWSLLLVFACFEKDFTTNLTVNFVTDVLPSHRNHPQITVAGNASLYL